MAVSFIKKKFFHNAWSHERKKILSDRYSIKFLKIFTKFCLKTSLVLLFLTVHLHKQVEYRTILHHTYVAIHFKEVPSSSQVLYLREMYLHLAKRNTFRRAYKTLLLL